MVAESFKISFFNVGQGNCTVIKHLKSSSSRPNSIQNKNVWIIDAGSSKAPLLLGYPVQETESDKLVTHITQWIGKNIKTLNIVLTHPDADHKNMIDRIVNTIKTRKPRQVAPSIQYFLGYRTNGHKFWSCAEGLKELGIDAPEGESVSIYETAGFNLDGTEWMDPANPYDSPVTFLGRRDFSGDTNQNSLIMKIRYNEMSILLTGDATGDTFDKDLDAEALDNLKADILLLSHHGADTHRSNSLSFLKKVNPTYCVLSAHLNSQHGHPAPRVLRVLEEFYHQSTDMQIEGPDDEYLFLLSNVQLDSLSIVMAKSHSVIPLAILQIKDVKDRTIEAVDWTQSPSEDTRTLYVTKHPIFYTGCHGTIIFTLKNDKTPNIAFYRYQRNSVQSEEPGLELLESYMKKEKIMENLREFLVVNKYTYAPLAINILEEEERKIGSLMNVLMGHQAFKTLRVLNLESSNMKISAEKIAEYVSSFPYLAKICAKQNLVDAGDPFAELLNSICRRFLYCKRNPL